ncbi:DUF6726 family protein [Candidatus Thioglobus sp.]|jgi:hypothetical protein|nr:DUF6726 family protein [Candidatus Thioglobus sp.]HIF47447.1 hypothetical protein [Candidatus Thioglobus sp.]HIL03087.1 hypothetical protein [Candidatus Thioglobus autotrophicus]
MIKIIMPLLAMLVLSSCVLTKVVTVPMRIGGAVISIVPGIGEGIDEAIDSAADTIDTIPI